MGLRLLLFALCTALAGGAARATPCAAVKAKPDAWAASETDALVRAARAAYESDKAVPAYERVLDRIAGTLRVCRLSKDEGFAARHREFVEYVEAAALDRSPEHELGFLVTDKQYFGETREFVRIPEFLTNQTFLRMVSRYETLGEAKAYLRRLNETRASADRLIFFSYTSRHLGTPDNNDSFRRLLVVVPGDADAGVPEKWVQFGVTDPGARVRTRNVSVVSTLAAGDGTSDVYFKDFYRTFKRDGTITLTGRWELGEGDDNCAQCHKSGVLPIFPVEGSVGADELPQVERVNERFRSYAPPRFGKYLDASKFGPGLGSASAAARELRFGAGFGSTNVARSMVCVACHQTQGLGALNWPMDRTIVSSFVRGGQMPLGYRLTDAERDELYQKLIQEYFSTDPARPGVLKSWLLGKLR